MGSAAFLARFGGGAVEEQDIQTESAIISQQLTESGGAAAFINKFAGVSESHWFYDNTVEIKFDKVEHKYFRVGDLGELIPLFNVSTVSKIIDRSPALIPWAAKVTVEKFLRIIPTVQQEGGGMVIPPMPFEKFSELAMEAKKAHSENLEDAGDVGKMAHDWLEQYIKAVMADDHTMIQGLMTQMCRDERASNCALAALDWMKAHNVRWLSTEHKVYSKKHDCCGTFDGICITDSCTDPSCCPTQFKDRKTLIDWKTSNYLYIEFIYQASAYKAFHLEEFPNDTIEDIWILRLGKEDGEFQPWHLYSETFMTDYAGFEACLALKKKATELEERMKEERAKIRVAKKKMREELKAKRIAEEKAAKKAERERLKAEKAAEREKLKLEAKVEREKLKKYKKLKAGSLRYIVDGEEHIAQPGDATFSTVTMCATEFWTGEKWESTGPTDSTGDVQTTIGVTADGAGSSPVAEQPQREPEVVRHEEVSSPVEVPKEKYEDHRDSVGAVEGSSRASGESGGVNSRAQAPSEGSGQTDQTCHESAVRVPEVQSPTELNLAAKEARANVVKVEAEQPRPTYVAGGIKVEQEQPSRPIFNIPMEG